MSFKHCLIFIFLIFSCYWTVYAQNEELPTRLVDIVEEIAAASEEELDYTSLFQNLEYIYENPLDLNTVTKEDFQDLIFLTDYQIYSILNYRRRYRGFISLFELQYVDGMDMNTLRLLLPFVHVSQDVKPKTIRLKNAFKYGKHSLMFRTQRIFQDKKGFIIPDSILDANPDVNRYLGGKDKLYLKYNFKYANKLSIGLTAENDEGEQFFKGAQKYGFDFYSANIQITDIGPIKKIILGDFTAQFGQGLTMWSGMSFGKSTYSTGIMKRAKGIDKYSSVNEFSFLRGQAATFSYKNFKFTEFVSYKPLDANFVSVNDSINDVEAQEYLTSFLESGFHRTPSEIAKRKTVNEFISGANLEWVGDRLRLGATGAFYNYSKPMSGGNRLVNNYNFRENNNFNFGIDYLYTLSKMFFFGETSMSRNRGYATINGLIIDLVPEVNFSLVYRNFSRDYQAFYSKPFCESNKSFNESGLFISSMIAPIKYWRIDAYVDFWRHPWIRTNVNAPSSGREYMTQITYFPRFNLEMYVLMKHKTKQKNASDIIFGTKPLVDESTTKYRYHIAYSLTNEWTFKNRIELVQYDKSIKRSLGYMIYQDVKYSPNNLPFTFTARFAVFDTEDFNSRVYAYEPDVLYGFSIPAYFGNGIKTLLVVKYAIIKDLNCWIKISNTYYNDRDKLGSGLDEIIGRNRTELKLQVRYTF